MRKCPFCLEEIQEEAVKCKHCGEWLTLSQMRDCKMRIGETLKLLRRRKQMTISRMSALTGVQSATLSKMENNKAIGSLKSYVSIAKALGLSLSELFAEMEKHEKDGKL